jgi:hypothetical protein
MKLSVLIAGFGLAAVLAGCSTADIIPAGLPGGAPSVQGSLGQLGTFTLKDIAAADAIAVANGDSNAHECFAAGQGLAKFVGTQQTLAGVGGLTVSGAISGFEAARVTARSVGTIVGGGVPDYLIHDCAPLVASVKLDAANFLAQLAAFGLKL